jgi:hypothetical protein
LGSVTTVPGDTETRHDVRTVEMSDILQTEKDYLKTKQAELAKEHPGKYLVIRKEEVIGAYDSYDEAVEAADSLGIGPFLVRSVHRPEDDPTLVVPALALGLL